MPLQILGRIVIPQGENGLRAYEQLTQMRETVLRNFDNGGNTTDILPKCCNVDGFLSALGLTLTDESL